MTPYPVIGFTRPAELYEFASNHGLHVGSMDQLERFSAALQQKAISHRALERMAANAEELGLYEEPEEAK